MGSMLQSAARAGLLWYVIFPLFCILFSIVLGGLMAAAEGIAYGDAFLFCLMELTATTTPLTMWAGPSGESGSLVILIVALVQLVLFSLALGMTAGPLLDPFLEPFMLVPRTGKAFFKKLALFFFVTLPVMFVSVAVVLGGIYAAAEGWPYSDGFWLILGEVTNSPPLGPVGAAPTSPGGKLMALVAGLTSSVIFGLLIAVIGAPLMGFDLSFADSPVVGAFPYLLLNAEQREERAKAGKSTRSQVAPALPPTASPSFDKVEEFEIAAQDGT